jgi:hypothetical protein
MKNTLFFLLGFLAIEMQGQSTFNNFSPDVLFGPNYPVRSIDLNNDGTPDFRFHHISDGVVTRVYLETLNENQILVRDSGFQQVDPTVNSVLLTTNPFTVLMPTHPSLTQVNDALVNEYLTICNQIVYWSTSDSVNQQGLMLYNNPTNLVNFSMSDHSCYDYYYCRVKMPGTNNYLYGYIQAFGYQAGTNGGVLNIGGTGYNPTVNGTANFDPSCLVFENYEPGPQTPELSSNQYANNASISILSIGGQIKIINHEIFPINDLQFSLFSITGALISKSVFTISSDSQITINESGLEKGIYLVELNWGDKKYFQKIIL